MNHAAHTGWVEWWAVLAYSGGSDMDESGDVEWAAVQTKCRAGAGRPICPNQISDSADGNDLPANRSSTMSRHDTAVGMIGLTDRQVDCERR